MNDRLLSNEQIDDHLSVIKGHLESAQDCEITYERGDARHPTTLTYKITQPIKATYSNIGTRAALEKFRDSMGDWLIHTSDDLCPICRREPSSHDEDCWVGLTLAAWDELHGL